MKFHPHMILDIRQCEQMTLAPGKTTVIIATSQADIKCLLWTIFSLLLRSNPGGIVEHISVVINGPDKRTGDPSLQDKKQAFLEELRDMKWGDRPMPLTVQRIWSRVGHAHALESAIPWVHTESYTICHDDVVICDNGWEDELLNGHFSDPEVALSYPLPYLTQGMGTKQHTAKAMLCMPHPFSFFVTARKSLLAAAGVRWYGYHVPFDFTLKGWDGLDAFRAYYSEQPEDGSPFLGDVDYGCLSMDIGAWVYYACRESGYKLHAMDPKHVLHLLAMSWGRQLKDISKDSLQKISELRTEIGRSPYAALYAKYI